MSWLTRMVMHSRGRKLLVGFEAAVRDPESTLRALLESFLVANANTVFGRDHNFAKIDSAEAYRRDMCNITGEKLHVGQVAEAFFRAIDEVSFEATQAQLIPDVESSRYDMLLETDEREEARLEMFAEAFDRQLRAMNMEYAGKRHSDRLGLPRIWCMKAGWSGYRQRVDVEQHGKRDAQYKWPFLQLSWDQLARDHVALPPPGVDGSVPAPASAE